MAAVQLHVKRLAERAFWAVLEVSPMMDCARVSLCDALQLSMPCPVPPDFLETVYALNDAFLCLVAGAAGWPC